MARPADDGAGGPVNPLIPAQAGTQAESSVKRIARSLALWVPAFAGMSGYWAVSVGVV